jgi:putative colanic acid biosynthesis acetyltransferase WcaF
MENVQMLEADLSKFSTGSYWSAPKWKVGFWYLINYFIFNSNLPWPYRIKIMLLRAFGAKIGEGLVIKTGIRIKNPWMLSIGDHCWIGESVWIDNLTDVIIGNNVCLSQGAILLTGNHDYSKIDFRYRLGTIRLDDGVWIGARSVVCANVHCASHSVLTVNSVASRNLEAWKIYSGNPALPVRDRKITA